MVLHVQRHLTAILHKRIEQINTCQKQDEQDDGGEQPTELDIAEEIGSNNIEGVYPQELSEKAPYHRTGYIVKTTQNITHDGDEETRFRPPNNPSHDILHKVGYQDATYANDQLRKKG